MLPITFNEKARRSKKEKRLLITAKPITQSALKEEYPIDVGFNDNIIYDAFREILSSCRQRADAALYHRLDAE